MKKASNCLNTRAVWLLVALNIITMFSLTSCSGIKLPDNCVKRNAITFAVMPFQNDEYQCHKNVEQKIAGLCYTVLNGEQILSEYCTQTGKNLSNITLDEFCNYAKSRGVNKLVFGNVKVVWIEGLRPTEVIAYYDNRDEVLPEEAMYQIVTGNYAQVNCYSIDTESKFKSDVFRNYNVKKVSLGMPSMLSGLNK